MAGNFEFLRAEPEWADLAERAIQAEQSLAIGPESVAINARAALEIAVRWLYRAERLSLADPYHPGRELDLFSMLQARAFRELIDDASLYRMLDQLRLVGNAAAHGGRRLTADDALLALKILFELGRYMAYCYSSIEHIPEKWDEAPKARSQEFAVDTLTEQETRRRFIDYDLAAAGWRIGDNARIEEALTGVPSASGAGFADYVLYGADGRPLAVVEAKRTSRDPEAGAVQAGLYADALAARYHRRPVIFLTNGFTTLLIDGASPRRQVAGFFSPDDLELLLQRRGDRQDLTRLEPLHAIAGRPYQLQALKSVAAAYQAGRRRALVVQATGTGKTRVAVSMVELMLRAGWVRRVLFLADRTELVRQAQHSFLTFFAGEIPLASLLDDGSKQNLANLLTSRVIFSTYPSMMNAIDRAVREDGSRIFTPASFDLIIIDESHRSIYQRYQAIFSYFDSYLLGLTATPKDEVDRNTYRFFALESGNPTFAYGYEEAVREGYLVPFEQLERTTRRLRDGLKYHELDAADREHYEEVFGVTDEDAEDIDAAEFNRYIFNRETVVRVLTDLMENGLYVEGGDRLGKTIIFAKNRTHARFIVDVFHELYPEFGDEFIAQIDGSIAYHDVLLDEFRRGGEAPVIAVSVDMLDTGIDVPEILNLVFFKMVRSYSKFWQMIGRGTRLCPDLFGHRAAKEKFYIFDYGGNFEFFSVEAQRVEPRVQPSLTERIFALKVNVCALLQGAADEEGRALAAELRTELHAAVVALDDRSFRVVAARETVEHYRSLAAWEPLTADAVQQVAREIAPLIVGTTEDISARLFDVRLLRMMYELLTESSIERGAADVRAVAERLLAPSKLTIPQVLASRELLEQVASTPYWEQMTVARLETVRRELRGLMQFLDRDSRTPLYTDFSDELIVCAVHEAHSPQTSEVYQRRVTEYLRAHLDNIAVHKLRTNKRLTAADLAELERILWQELGTEADYRVSYGDMPIGRLVRRTLGMDRAALEEAFAEFLDGESLSLAQLDFVRRIIDYVAVNGELAPQEIMQKKPFAGVTDITRIFANRLDTVRSIMTRLTEVGASSTEIA